LTTGGHRSSFRSPGNHSYRTHTPWLMPATHGRGCTHWGVIILGDGMAVTAHVLRVVCGTFAGPPPTRGFRAPRALPTALHAPCTRQQQWQRGPSHIRGVWRPQATASALQGRRSQQWRARRTCARGGWGWRVTPRWFKFYLKYPVPYTICHATLRCVAFPFHTLCTTIAALRATDCLGDRSPGVQRQRCPGGPGPPVPLQQAVIVTDNSLAKARLPSTSLPRPHILFA
jgi:hypothetical protein